MWKMWTFNRCDGELSMVKTKRATLLWAHFKLQCRKGHKKVLTLEDCDFRVVTEDCDLCGIHDKITLVFKCTECKTYEDAAFKYGR